MNRALFMPRENVRTRSRRRFSRSTISRTHSAGPAIPGTIASTFANNDLWFDDISDGPVDATVRIAGRDIPDFAVDITLDVTDAALTTTQTGEINPDGGETVIDWASANDGDFLLYPIACAIVKGEMQRLEQQLFEADWAGTAPTPPAFDSVPEAERPPASPCRVRERSSSSRRSTRASTSTTVPCPDRSESTSRTA